MNRSGLHPRHFLVLKAGVSTISTITQSRCQKVRYIKDLPRIIFCQPTDPFWRIRTFLHFSYPQPAGALSVHGATPLAHATDLHFQLAAVVGTRFGYYRVIHKCAEVGRSYCWSTERRDVIGDINKPNEVYSVSSGNHDRYLQSVTLHFTEISLLVYPTRYWLTGNAVFCIVGCFEGQMWLAQSAPLVARENLGGSSNYIIIFQIRLGTRRENVYCHDCDLGTAQPSRS